MSFPATSTPAFAVFNNDLQGPPEPSVPSMLPKSEDIDYPSVLLTLDSWVPILKHPPGLYLDQNIYYIRGSIAAVDWARLRDCARMVSKFIVTDKASEPIISPSVYLRVARLQQHDRSLFPSLSDLVIVKASASISHLELLLTPSLKSLEVSRIPAAQQSTFFSFLTAIEQEAPLLQTLILGPGRFSSSSLWIISKFNSLCHLEMKLKNSELPPVFFENIGSLPMLEVLVLNARHVSSTNQFSVEKPAIPSIVEDVPRSPNSNLMEGNHNKDSGDVRTCDTSGSISPSNAFTQLKKLDVLGWLALFEDLVPRIMSTKLEDISFSFLRLSHDSLAEERATCSKKRSRETGETRKTTRLEQERLTTLSFDAHTASFLEILRKLCCQSPASIKTVFIYQSDGSFEFLSNSPILPENIFRTSDVGFC